MFFRHRNYKEEKENNLDQEIINQSSTSLNSSNRTPHENVFVCSPKMFTLFLVCGLEL
jgi:hypothetical protein